MKVQIIGMVLLLTSTGCGSGDSAGQAQRAASHGIECQAVTERNAQDLPIEQLEEALADCQGQRATVAGSERDFSAGLILYQLDSTEASISRFGKAAQAGHCTATYYAAFVEWEFAADSTKEFRQSLLPRVEAAYETASQCGEKRAQAQLFPYTEFDTDSSTSSLTKLYRGDIEELNRVRFASAAYFSGVLTEMSHLVGDNFRGCWAQEFVDGAELLQVKAAFTGNARNPLEAMANEKMLASLFLLTFPELGSSPLDEFREIAKSAAAADVKQLDARVSCEGPVAFRLKMNLGEFAKASRPLVTQLTQLSKETKSLAEMRAVIAAAAQ